MPQTLRLLVALEEASVRERVREALSKAENLVVVGEVDNGKDGLDELERLAPDVVILGCQLVDTRGIDIVSEVQRRQLSTRVVAFSSQAEHCIQAMVKAGVTTYIVDGEHLEFLPDAIEVAVWGEPHFNLWGADSSVLLPGGIEAIVDEYQPDQLTDRQIQIAYLIGQRKTNKQIAQALHFSKSTIETEVRIIRQAIGASSRLDLARWARRNIPRIGPSEQDQG